jgi:transcriptional regulator with XRE-family HTH domain
LAFLLLSVVAWPIPACRKIEPARLDPVRALRSGAEPRFRPPEDGLLSDAQIDLYVRARRSAGGRSQADVASVMGVDPAEVAWIEGRIVQALSAVDARTVTEAVDETYGRAIATVREARRATSDARVAARLDVEIATLEKERSGLRRAPRVAPAVSRNAERISVRRAEIEALGR